MKAVWTITTFITMAVLAACLAFLLAGSAGAHEIRPAYLEIVETSAGLYDVTWRTPLLSGAPLPVALALPQGTRDLSLPVVMERSDSRIERRQVEVPGGLPGKSLRIVGLEATITDVLVRVQLADGIGSTTLVHPSKPEVTVAATPGRFDVAKTYIVHGIEHILGGYDHLLFVLALMLIVPSWRSLLATVSAFTLAHSITLSLATFGVLHVPGPPVEATIALSILLLACEIRHVQQGKPSITARRPWLVAFAFGLLHGLGFAGALTELGLPAGEVPLALLAFNIGVEIGQLAFIAVLLAAVALARRLRIPFAGSMVRMAATYGIGIMAAFWFTERVLAF